MSRQLHEAHSARMNERARCLLCVQVLKAGWKMRIEKIRKDGTVSATQLKFGLWPFKQVEVLMPWARKQIAIMEAAVAGLEAIEYGIRSGKELEHVCKTETKEMPAGAAVTAASVSFTETELATFKRLRDKTGSRNGGVRVLARLSLSNFIEAHGERKCQAMYDELMKR